MPAEEVTDDVWDVVNTSGARGTWMCSQAAFPHLRDQGGSIVNFASAAGLVGAPWLLPYAATKGAIVAMTHTMAQEWGRYRIRVNAVAPAAMTPATEIWMQQVLERAERTGEPPPHGIATADPGAALTGPLDPETNIAPAVAFLASDDACHVTGQTLCVDGGVVMH
jgi:NAD(P)-dependent dehydrogenase (short-subunit alcohol dehydrogenase family)